MADNWEQKKGHYIWDVGMEFPRLIPDDSSPSECSYCEETMAKAQWLGITGKALDDMQYWLRNMAKDAALGSLSMSDDEEIDGLLRREG